MYYLFWYFQMLKTEKNMPFLTNKEFVFLFNWEIWMKKFVDSFLDNSWKHVVNSFKDANGRFICAVPGCSSEKSWTSSFSVWHHFNSEHANMQGTLLKGIIIWSGAARSLSPLYQTCFSSNFSLFQFETKTTSNYGHRPGFHLETTFWIKLPI